MMRFKDKRERDAAASKYGEAQLAFHAMRTNFAMQLASGGALNREDVAEVFQVADALAREDVRLRHVETKLLADALEQPYDAPPLPQEGKPFTIEVRGPALVKP